MKNKKMLKVLSTSFILGTILMTSPSFAEKIDEISINEISAKNMQDGKSGKELVDSSSTDNKEIITSNSTDSKEISDVEKDLEKDLDKDLEKVSEIEKEESTDNSSTDKSEVKEDSTPKINEYANKENEELEISENLTSDAVGVGNGEWVELSNEPGKTHKVRLVDYRQDKKETVWVTIEGETNTTGEYSLRLSTPVYEYLDSDTLVKKQLSFDKSKEQMEEDVYKAVMNNAKKVKSERMAFILTTTQSEIINQLIDKPIGYVKSGTIVINYLSKNLKTTKYKVTLELENVIFGKTLESGKKNILTQDLNVLVNRKNNKKIGKVDAEITPEGRPFKKGTNVSIRSGNTQEGKKSVDIINDTLINTDSSNMQKLKSEIINNVERFEVVDSKHGYRTKLWGINVPTSYITKENKLHYSIEIINPENFDITANINNEDNLVYNKLTLKDKASMHVKIITPDEINSMFLQESSVNNPNLQQTNGTSIYRGERQYIGTESELILENVKLNNGNISFDYYTEGSDKRSLLRNPSALYFTDEDKKFKPVDYLDKPLYLKNLSLINNDGSYNIPMYRIRVTRGNEVISDVTTRIQGKLSIPSGSSFSDLYKITHEDREEVVKIPIETEKIADDTILKGEEKLIQQGEVVSKKVVYDIQFVDGKEYSKVEKSAKVIKEMKPKIIHYGTAEKLVDKKTEAVKYETIYEVDQTLNYEEKKLIQQGKDGSK